MSLKGRIDAPAWTEGEAAEVAVPLADLLAGPGGALDRQILLGDPVTVIDRQDDWAFVQAGKDAYCGWVAAGALARPTRPGHWVATLGTHLYPEPRVQARPRASLTLGARLRVTGQEGAFASTPHGWVPAAHLAPLGRWHTDPAEVAGLFLGVPYLWGGNSRDGLDCSGLAQAARLACGLPCPGDSDLQQAALPPAPDALQRNDLVFWPGHVALMLDGGTVIHANGHHMAVTTEPLATVEARIGPHRAARRG